jgi:hypothetical protein
MRFSIWRQFSSNHSTFFTIVGQFETNEAAQAAYEVWLRLIKGVIEWRQQNPDADYDVRTPIELDYDQRYGIELDKYDHFAITWFDDDPKKVLTQYDNIVSVGTVDETWNLSMGPESLMKALGAKTAMDETETSETLLTTICEAPDDATAQRVYDEIRAGMKEVPGKNYDYKNDTSVEAVHIVLESPEAIKGKYERFEMKREGRKFTFVDSRAKLRRYLRAQGFTNFHHEVTQIPDWGA